MGEGSGGGDAAQFVGDHLIDAVEIHWDLVVLDLRGGKHTPSQPSPIEGEGSEERHRAPRTTFIAMTPSSFRHQLRVRLRGGRPQA